MEVFNFVCMAIAAASALAAVVAFFRNSKKDAVQETQAEAASDRETLAAQVRLEANLLYIKNGVDDIRIDQKAQAAELKKVEEKLARLEEHSKEQDRRLEKLEGVNND